MSRKREVLSTNIKPWVKYRQGTWCSQEFSGRNHSEETKTIISETKKGEKNYNFGKTHSEETKQKPSGAGKASQVIEVTDKKNNTTTSYDSIHAAARALNISYSSINMYFLRNQQKPYKGQYIFKKVN